MCGSGHGGGHPVRSIRLSRGCVYKRARRGGSGRPETGTSEHEQSRARSSSRSRASRASWITTHTGSGWLTARSEQKATAGGIRSTCWKSNVRATAVVSQLCLR